MTNSKKQTFNDEEFLDAFISSIFFLTQAIPHQMIVIKNLQSEHIFCSEYFADLTGVKSNELIGKKVWLPLYKGSDESEIETILRREDQTIINNRTAETFLKINRFSNGLLPYLSIKSPIINPYTDHVVGILFQGFEMGNFNFSHYLKNLNLPEVKVNNTLPELSKREKQVIFFFLSNLSSQEIAEAIYLHEGKKITKSTIDSVFNDQLYVKFNVHSRPTLYEKLKALGYETKVPKELLNTVSLKLNILNPY